MSLSLEIWTQDHLRRFQCYSPKPCRYSFSHRCPPDAHAVTHVEHDRLHTLSTLRNTLLPHVRFNGQVASGRLTNHEPAATHQQPFPRVASRGRVPAMSARRRRRQHTGKCRSICPHLQYSLGAQGVTSMGNLIALHHKVERVAGGCKTRMIWHNLQPRSAMHRVAVSSLATSLHIVHTAPTF